MCSLKHFVTLLVDQRGDEGTPEDSITGAHAHFLTQFRLSILQFQLFLIFMTFSLSKVSV